MIGSIGNLVGSGLKVLLAATVVLPGVDLLTESIADVTQGSADGFGAAVNDISNSLNDVNHAIAEPIAGIYNAVGVDDLAGKVGDLNANDLTKDFGILDNVIGNADKTFAAVLAEPARPGLIAGAIGGTMLASEFSPVKDAVHEATSFAGRSARSVADAGGKAFHTASSAIGGGARHLGTLSSPRAAVAHHNV